MLVMGLDVGRRRIGVAVSDPTGFLARGVQVLQRASLEEDLAQLCALIDSLAVERVVVGHPISLSGQAGPQALEAEQFADSLREIVPVPVLLWDERLSTLEADRRMQEAGRKGRERRQRVDMAAATLILQSYLDSLRGEL